MPYSQDPVMKPHLTTRSLHPENQETPIQFIETDVKVVPDPQRVKVLTQRGSGTFFR